LGYESEIAFCVFVDYWGW